LGLNSISIKPWQALEKSEVLKRLFLKTLLDTDATDFVAMAPHAALSFTDTPLKKQFFSVYRKESDIDLRNTL
jgi:hypothetical protein